MKKLVIVGGGFAGVWSALGAAWKLHEKKADHIEIVLISPHPDLHIRPRLYEQDLSDVRVPLDSVLQPVGIRNIQGMVRLVHPMEKQIVLDGERTLSYDRLVLAAGSRLHRPDIPGLDEWTFDVDTYEGAVKLDRHLRSLPHHPVPGREVVVVVGGGFTGVEIAAEMVDRLQNIGLNDGNIVIIEKGPVLGADWGPHLRAVVQEALDDLGIETRLSTSIRSVTRTGVELDTGERITAATVIWAAGMRANPLTRTIPAEKDELGRLLVDEFLRVNGHPHIFAAGDTAKAKTDDTHHALMSCQHAIPQGKIAGHNAAADLLGEPMKPYRQERYVTCLDLGPWGAVFTEGWDRAVKATKKEAKKIKQTINRVWIYPPVGNAADILAVAAPDASHRRNY
ncbi:NAD(P)/FAD-dependent oxidoreductase [Polycladomyces subterraneus]|uniref:FAD-dependent oxidoreductase n=1 Tax=Polycladomyces subterraneus TaxID=1016997 RepID=A0ABT8IMK1_9BACL|nr:FAD-dependent oxidoreductase [Polycladomyces subterraneus]MDN4593989.1 FAD-dependent oxidoreductase [Polycladomyces subterraneus]